MPHIVQRVVLHRKRPSDETDVRRERGDGADAASVSFLPPPPLLVACGPVSVLMGVLRADGVLLAADRALTNPAERVAAGVPYQWHNRTKLGLTPTGVAIGLAGRVGVGVGHTGPAADLLTAALRHAHSGHRGQRGTGVVRCRSR